MGARLLRVATGLTLGFLYLPIAVIVLYSFNASRIVQSWPIENFTTEWYAAAFGNPTIRDALALSLTVAAVATITALVLGSLAALAVDRYRFFGRDAISFSLVLPLALPGIVTGIALNNTFNGAIEGFKIPLGTLTIAIGHATFCVVVVYNNVVARLRRSSRSIEEASRDLGADTLQTFRYITFPTIRSAILAGALLAFALSFDEIVVTTFTSGTQVTIPIWILNHYKQPNQQPIVNVVAVLLILLSTVPVYLAQRLSSSSGTEGRT